MKQSQERRRKEEKADTKHPKKVSTGALSTAIAEDDWDEDEATSSYCTFTFFTSKDDSDSEDGEQVVPNASDISPTLPPTTVPTLEVAPIEDMVISEPEFITEVPTPAQERVRFMREHQGFEDNHRRRRVRLVAHNGIDMYEVCAVDKDGHLLDLPPVLMSNDPRDSDDIYVSSHASTSTPQEGAPISSVNHSPSQHQLETDSLPSSPPTQEPTETPTTESPRYSAAQWSDFATLLLEIHAVGRHRHRGIFYDPGQLRCSNSAEGFVSHMAAVDRLFQSCYDQFLFRSIRTGDIGMHNVRDMHTHALAFARLQTEPMRVAYLGDTSGSPRVNDWMPSAAWDGYDHELYLSANDMPDLIDPNSDSESDDDNDSVASDDSFFSTHSSDSNDHDDAGGTAGATSGTNTRTNHSSINVVSGSTSDSASNADSHTTAILDSGAMEHVVSNPSLLSAVNPLRHPVNVVGVGGHKIRVTHHGPISAFPTQTALLMPEVRFHREADNIISLPQIADSGYHFAGDAEAIDVYDSSTGELA